MQNVPKPGNVIGGTMTSALGMPIAASWVTSRGPIVSWKNPLSIGAIEVENCVVSIAWLPPPSPSGGMISNVRVPMRFESTPLEGARRSCGTSPCWVAGCQ